MPWVGFETTIPASERAKAVHALDRSATVTGKYLIYCHVFMVVTNNNGVWIGWLDLLTPSLPSLVITIPHNKSSAEPFFLDRRGLAPFSFSFDSVLYYLHNLEGGHTENTASSTVVFTAPLLLTEVIRLLPTYSLPRECVYRDVA
jgi:hypothetical protein